jgi:hypothetical protein
MNNLKIGAFYIVGFPQTAYKSIYKLVAIHTPVARSDVAITFMDHAGFKVMLTKGVYTIMSVAPVPPPPLPISPDLDPQNDSEVITFNDIFDDTPIPPSLSIGTPAPGDYLTDEELYG